MLLLLTSRCRKNQWSALHVGERVVVYFSICLFVFFREIASSSPRKRRAREHVLSFAMERPGTNYPSGRLVESEDTDPRLSENNDNDQALQASMTFFEEAGSTLKKSFILRWRRHRGNLMDSGRVERGAEPRRVACFWLLGSGGRWCCPGHARRRSADFRAAAQDRGPGGCPGRRLCGARERRGRGSAPLFP